MSHIPWAIWIQFWRNFLCCMKAIIPLLQKFQLSIVAVNQFYDLSVDYLNLLTKPIVYYNLTVLSRLHSIFGNLTFLENVLRKTSLIEYAISITQFAAVIFNFQSGLSNMLSGFKSYQYSHRYYELLQKRRPDESDYDNFNWLSYTGIIILIRYSHI